MGDPGRFQYSIILAIRAPQTAPLLVICCLGKPFSWPPSFFRSLPCLDGSSKCAFVLTYCNLIYWLGFVNAVSARMRFVGVGWCTDLENTMYGQLSLSKSSPLLETFLELLEYGSTCIWGMAKGMRATAFLRSRSTLLRRAARLPRPFCSLALMSEAWVSGLGV